MTIKESIQVFNDAVSQSKEEKVSNAYPIFYETDYIAFNVNDGTFEFKEEHHPYIFGTEDLQRNYVYPSLSDSDLLENGYVNIPVKELSKRHLNSLIATIRHYTQGNYDKTTTLRFR